MTLSVVVKPDQEYCSSLIDYNPETGSMVWKERDSGYFKKGKQSQVLHMKKWNTRYSGEELGHLDDMGYKRVLLLGFRCRVHQLAWLLHYGEWPPEQIDHVNGNRTDNRIANLRLASNRDNARNMSLRVDSATGVTGVVLIPGSRYRAQISVDGKNIYLGNLSNNRKGI